MCLYVLLIVIIYAGESIDIQSTVYTYAVYIYIDMLYKYNLSMYIYTYSCLNFSISLSQVALWLQDDEPSEGESKEGEKSGEAEGLLELCTVGSIQQLIFLGHLFSSLLICWCPVFCFCEGHEGKLDFWRHFLAKWRWLLTLSGEAKAEDGTKDGDKKECLG